MRKIIRNITIALTLLTTQETNIMGQNNAKKETRENPFFVEYSTPRGTIPFDKIRADDYMPAFEEGIKRAEAEVEAIVNNMEEPTFENTIAALERSGSLLSKVEYPFFNMLSAESNDTLEQIAQEVQPKLTDHSNKILYNARLFERVKVVYDKRKGLKLDAEDSMLLDDTYKGFVRSGALLSKEDQKKCGEIMKELSLTTLDFGQRCLKATNAFEMVTEDKKELAGLPEDIMQAAKERAKAKGKTGYMFDLSYPSYMPFMKFADNRELRRKMYMGYNTKAYGGEFDNQENVKKIVSLRMRMAKMSGYETFADRVLEERMAKGKEGVYGLLDQLLGAYMPVAEKEREELQEYAEAKGFEGEIQPWDWSYYSNKLKEEKYSFNDSIVKPYLELEHVKKGVFGLATELYGLTFRKNKDIPVYHKDVEAFEVYDGDGEYIAVLYTDFHPRAGKQNGAWMTEFKQQWKENGENSRPHISLVMNFSRPVGDRPALLTFDELTTFLHEFGHSLHGMLAQGKYASLSGTNVMRDFVEMPSQLMENWAFEKEFLDQFAVNYETGEKMPEELIERLRAAQNYHTGYACVRQLSFGYLDMAWHTMGDKLQVTGYGSEDLEKLDVKEFEGKAWKKALLLPEVDGTCMSTQFTHIFDGGYAAGYYGYKWAEVLDADVFSEFKKHGIFNKETAARFRHEILEKGGSEHPMTLYKRFMGREPKIDALLKRNGVNN